MADYLSDIDIDLENIDASLTDLNENIVDLYKCNKQIAMVLTEALISLHKITGDYDPSEDYFKFL